MTKITRTCTAKDYKVLVYNNLTSTMDEMEITVIEPNEKKIKEQLNEAVGLHTNGSCEYFKTIDVGEIYAVKLTMDLAAALSVGTIERMVEKND